MTTTAEKILVLILKMLQIFRAEHGSVYSDKNVIYVHCQRSIR